MGSVLFLLIVLFILDLWWCTNYHRATYNLFGKVKFTCLECGRERVVSAWWCRWPFSRISPAGAAYSAQATSLGRSNGTWKGRRLTLNMQNISSSTSAHWHICTFQWALQYISTSVRFSELISTFALTDFIIKYHEHIIESEGQRLAFSKNPQISIICSPTCQPGS